MIDVWPLIAIGSSALTLVAVSIGYRTLDSLRFERAVAAAQKFVIKEMHARISALEAENMEWARREVRRLRRLKAAGNKGRETQAAMRAAIGRAAA